MVRVSFYCNIRPLRDGCFRGRPRRGQRRKSTCRAGVAAKHSFRCALEAANSAPGKHFPRGPAGVPAPCGAPAGQDGGTLSTAKAGVPAKISAEYRTGPSTAIRNRLSDQSCFLGGEQKQNSGRKGAKKSVPNSAFVAPGKRTVRARAGRADVAPSALHRSLPCSTTHPRRPLHVDCCRRRTQSDFAEPWILRALGGPGAGGGGCSGHAACTLPPSARPSGGGGVRGSGAIG